MLEVSDQSIRRWVKAGELRAYKPKKEYRIAESDLEEFLKERKVPLVQAPLPDFEEERSVTPVAASTLKEQIAFIARLKEQRETEIEQVKGGDAPPFGWTFQLEAADSYLHKIHDVAGISDYVEEVTAGRMMTSFEVKRLCHELSREFSNFQRLTDEARALEHERHSDAYVEGVKGVAEIEAWMQPPQSRAEESSH